MDKDQERIAANRRAWSTLSEEHYHAFKARFAGGEQFLNTHIAREVGDLTGKRVLHLQCNTGADTLLLAKTAAHVTGVDFVPENVLFARRLAGELGVENVDFLEGDVMRLPELGLEPYDVVFTSEGVLGWLSDLVPWAKGIAGLLKEDGYLYVFDSHPFFLSFDEELLPGQYVIRYPYFGPEPDESNEIGGYAAPVKKAVNYYWMHPVSDIIGAVTQAGLHVEWFHEFTENYYDSGGMTPLPGTGLWHFPDNTDKYPVSFSMRATVYRPAK